MEVDVVSDVLCRGPEGKAKTTYISAANAPSLQPVQFEFTHKMLVQLLDKPEDFLAITRQ